MGNFWISISAAFGAFGVVMGAFAAHGLQGKVEEKALEWVRTGSHYQLIHALALLGWSLWAQARGQVAGSAFANFPGWGFSLGILIFSGTLYLMALGAPRWLGAITPFGGVLLILAWVIFGFHAIRS